MFDLQTSPEAHTLPTCYSITLMLSYFLCGRNYFTWIWHRRLPYDSSLLLLLYIILWLY